MMIQRTIRGPPNALTGSTSNQLTPKAPYKPAPAKAGVAVSLSLANHDASLAVAHRLYRPEDWAKDEARRPKAKIPETIAFQTKPEITLEQIKAAQTAGLPRGVVLMDAGYAGIGSNTSVWPPDAAPLPPQARSGRGRPQKRLQRDGQHRPISVKQLALRLPEEVWQTIA
jgi:SRSO17 transposase